MTSHAPTVVVARYKESDIRIAIAGVARVNSYVGERLAVPSEIRMHEESPASDLYFLKFPVLIATKSQKSQNVVEACGVIQSYRLSHGDCTVVQ